MYAGFGDDDGPIAVQELPAILGVAETFGEWKGRCEPRDCFGHVGVVEHGYYGACLVPIGSSSAWVQRLPQLPWSPKYDWTNSFVNNFTWIVGLTVAFYFASEAGIHAMNSFKPEPKPNQTRPNGSTSETSLTPRRP